MMKKLVSFILCLVFLAGCRQQPGTDTSGSQSTDSKAQNTEEYCRFIEITEPVHKSDFEDRSVYDTSSLSLDKDNISIRSYTLDSQAYGQWTSWTICRYEDDMMTHRLELKEYYFSQQDADGYSLRPHTTPINIEANDDLTQITLTGYYTDHCRIFINFETEVVEYSLMNSLDEYRTLSELDDTQLEQTVMESYLQPLADAGLIGHYYKDVNAIDKMLAYFANEAVLKDPLVMSVDYTLDEENGYATVDAELVKRYLELKFRDVDRYSFEENENYNPDNDTFSISIKDTVAEKVNIDITEIDLNDTYMWVTYNILDENGQITSNETAFFDKRHGMYLFSGAMTDYNTISFDEPVSGDYTFEELDGDGAGDGWWKEMALVNTKTGQKKNIGRITSSYATDYGFFTNGDVYITDLNAFRSYDRNMNNPAPLFTTEKNFPAGENFDGKGTDRYIFAVRRENADKYLVVYGEYKPYEKYEDNFIDDMQRVHTYRIAVLDGSGKVVQSWETDLPIIFSAMGYHAVNIKKVQDNYFEIYVTYKYEEYMRFGFDISTGKLTHIKSMWS